MRMRAPALRTMLLVSLLCLTGLATYAQQVVTGVVLDDADSSPLPGATIGAVAPGTKDTPGTASTITNDEGAFSLTVPEGTTHLLVVYLGYTQQVVPCTSGAVTVRLVSEDQQIEQVIVTGYGKIERRKSTASVASVSMDELPKSAMSIDGLLQGAMAGVSVMPVSGAPGAAAKIRIRGTSSLQGTQDPLWVLDGMPLEGTELPKVEDLANIDQLYSSSIAGVNPEDIASVSVLRDAAATAIYGARAANGVIVITTKQGAKGRLHVNYAGKLSVTMRPSIERMGLLNSEEKIALELHLARKENEYDYLSSKGEVARILKRNGVYDSYALGGALDAASMSSLDSLAAINTDWNKELFRVAFSQDHYLSLSGGADWASYFVSMGYYDEAGTTIGVSARRYNITAKTNFNFGDRVKAGVSLYANERSNYSFLSGSEGFTNPVYYSRTANPYLMPLNPRGGYLYDQDMNAYGRDGSVLPFSFLEERANTSNRLRTRSATVLFDLSWRIWRGITYEGQVGLQYDNRMSFSHAGENSYVMRKDMYISKNRLPTGGRVQNSDGSAMQWTIRNMVRWTELFADIHSIEVMLGNEVRRTTDENVYSAAYGYDANTLTSKPVLFESEIQARQFPLFRRNAYENAFVSFFATASYTLMSRYTLGGSIRFDGSNLFGVDPKYRYLPLYSVSAMWDVTQEPWMQDVEWISDLRIRASYGLQGNVDKSTSPLLIGEWTTDVTILPGGPGEKSITVLRPPNSRLRWEKTATYNAGFDFSIIRNRFKISFDYYYRYSSDLIGMRRLPLESGFDYTTINWSSLMNRGVEVNLNLLLLQLNGWTWDMQANFAYNENRIDRLTTRNDSREPSGEGYPVGGIFTLPYAGIDDYGYPLIYAPSGQKVLMSELVNLQMSGATYVRTISPRDERNLYQYAGTEEPPYSAGLSSRVAWKGWELSVAAVGNFGHKFLVQPYYDFTLYDRGVNTSSLIFDRWSPTNPSGTLPRLISENALGGARRAEYAAYNEFNYHRKLDLFLRDASYIRLQSIRIGYTFPDEWVKRIYLQRINISLEGKNLFVYGFDYKGFIDPETMKNPYAQPIPRTFILAVNIGF